MIRSRFLAIAAAVSMWGVPAAADDSDDPAPSAKPPTAIEIYEANRRGRISYRAEQYDEAYPLLMVAAQRGIKSAQAQIGSLHLHALGGAENDPRLVIGWLGVAASGDTDAKIQETFDEAWEQVPESNRLYYIRLIKAFTETYGSDAHGVKCGIQSASSTSREANFDCFFSDNRYGALIDDPYRTLERMAMGEAHDRNIPQGGRGQEYRDYVQRVHPSQGLPAGSIGTRHR